MAQTVQTTTEGMLEVTSSVYEGDDLKTKTPNIVVRKAGVVLLHLTWDEARELAGALRSYADICEHG